MNIYVGNLAFETTEDELKQIFGAFGQVDSVSIIKDKFTGQSRGFGFIEMPANFVTAYNQRLYTVNKIF